MALKKSIDQLFVFRFLAALVVVTHHYGLSILSDSGFWFEVVNNGGFILSFFFVLSGFVLGYNYLDPERFSAKNFLIRRFSRLVPTYLIAFFASLFTLMFCFSTYPKGLSIILQGLFLHAWAPSMVIDINYPSWSVSVEVLFILTFPLFVRMFGNMRLRNLLIVTVLIWILSSLEHILLETYLSDPSKRWTGEFILYFPVWHLNAFVFGLAGAQLFKKVSEMNIQKWIPPTIGLTSVALILIITGTDNAIRPHIHNGLLSPIMALMLLAFSVDVSVVSKIAAWKPMVYLGNLTYAIYIFQYPVHMWTEMAFFPNGIQGYDFYIYVLILLLFSALSYSIVEVSAQKFIVRWTESRIKRS